MWLRKWLQELLTTHCWKKEVLKQWRIQGNAGRPQSATPPPPPSFLDQIVQIETAPSPLPPSPLSQGRDECAHPAHPLSEGLESGSATVKFCEQSKFIGPKCLRGQIARLPQLNKHIPCISHFSSARIHHTAPLYCSRFFSTSAKTLWIDYTGV